MAEPVVERAWTCLGCGKPWTTGLPPSNDDVCVCGDDRWAYRAAGQRTEPVEDWERYEAAVNDPPRSKAGNAARLEAMAAEAETKRLQELAVGLMYVTLTEERDQARAERDRLAVIVDLACAEHEARDASEDGFDYSDNYPEWRDARDAFRAAVAAEVARRAAL
jgi:hypothetical protein